jgi:carboxylate-amine ligase
MTGFSAVGPTLGLEEELHVALAGSGQLTSAAPNLLAHLGDELPDVGRYVAELTLSQLETVTGVATSVGDVLGRAFALRAAAAQAAADLGLALLASGGPPLGVAADQQVAADDRYISLRERGAALVPQQLIAGMHLHIGHGSLDVSTADSGDSGTDDDARVRVVRALRPWLPTLLAMTANSPYWLGTDTGFASYRHVHWQRWPVAGAPPAVVDGAGWHAAVDALVRTGVVDDASFVYWDVRLATRFPTVELRVADVVPTVDDAAAFVALVRALAAEALAAGGTASDDRVRAGSQNRLAPPVTPGDLAVLRAASWRAARYGLSDRLVRPATGDLAPAADVLSDLLAAAEPGLEITGDGALARDGLARLLRDGNGADRQRRAFERRGWQGVLDVIRLDPAAPAFQPTRGDGNGWVDCVCGQRHWGRHGAAGLLVARPGPQGPQVLLQLRAAWTHQGGTWGLPGGARDSHESAAEAARREAWEEAGIAPEHVGLLGEQVDDHGPWSYTYVLAAAPPATEAKATNRESDEVAWLELADVDQRPLHPGLGAAWPSLRLKLTDLLAD